MNLNTAHYRCLEELDLIQFLGCIIQQGSKFYPLVSTIVLTSTLVSTVVGEKYPF